MLKSRVDVAAQLRQQIKDKKIVFWDGNKKTKKEREEFQARLQKELLKENSVPPPQVTTTLPLLVLKLSEIAAGQTLHINNLLRPSSKNTLHDDGRGLDIHHYPTDPNYAKNLLNAIATNDMVKQLNIDEIIFDARVAGETEANKNKWNYKNGKKFPYSDDTLRPTPDSPNLRHDNHIHFSVKL